MIGDFKNGGSEWHPEGKPERVRVHDFVDKSLGTVIPYRVYNTARNEAWVSVGVNHDTAEFAVATLRRWWSEMAKKAYPDATELLVTADGGGSNGARSHLCILELQRFAADTGLDVSVCHFPPGRANGTRSNIGSSPKSRRTVAAEHSSAARPSLTSLAALQPRRGSVYVLV